MAAYGLYTHIQANRRRSVILLIGLFVLVYVLVFAGALVAEVLLSGDIPLEYLLRGALYNFSIAVAVRDRRRAALDPDRLQIPPVDDRRDHRRATMSAATRNPRLYNLLENLCISRGIPMPKLKIAESRRSMPSPPA